MRQFRSDLMIALAISVCGSQKLPAQLFTRITDPSMELVTDAQESGGGSWIDVNNDGYLDLFVSNGNLTSQDDALYINVNGTAFLKIIDGAIVNSGGSSIGSTWGDIDGDGDLDAFITNRDNFGNFLFEGIGGTEFQEITTGAVVDDFADSNSSSWVDIDNDGDLDLYVVNFSEGDLLYLNSGAPLFDLLPASPISTTSDHSISGAWADMNNDLLPDLFICNSGTSSDDLYRNNGGLDLTHTSIDDGRATMGASWGDFNNDGYLDLYAANFLQHGNILYQNSGPPDYQLAPTLGTIPEVAANCVGSVWGDVDNDGDLDLYVGNDGGNNFLFINNGPPSYTFSQVTDDPCVLDGGQTFGCSMADYDNDGHLDIFAANRLNEPNFLYRNNGNNNHWATIRCIGPSPNSSAIGTKVKVKANINGMPITQTQEVSAQSGYNSQNLWLHFGLGDAGMIDTVIMIWPDGSTDTCTNIPADQHLVAMQGGCVDQSVISHIDTGSLMATLFPNPTSSDLTLTYSMEGSARLEISIIDGLGRVIQKMLNDRGSDKGSVILNVSSLPAGSYSVVVKTGIRSKVLRFDRVH